MKNRQLELDNELNKTNGESEEIISVSGNLLINGGAHGVFETSWKLDTEGNGDGEHSWKVRAG